MISGRTPLTYFERLDLFTRALEQATGGALVLGLHLSPGLEDALVEVIDAEAADRADATARAWATFHAKNLKPQLAQHNSIATSPHPPGGGGLVAFGRVAQR